MDAMNNRQLSYFLEAYKCRSIKLAAQNLIISPQGLSKTIQSLEEELNTALFRRTSKGIEPTNAAIALKPRAERVIEEYEAIKNEAVNQTDGRRVFTIVSTNGIFQYLTVKFLQDFQKLFPDIVLNYVEMTDYPAIDKLKNGEVELALLPSPIDTTLFTGQHLFTNRLCLVVNKQHPLSKKDKIRIEDLKDEPLARPSREYACYSNQMNIFLDHGVTPNICFETTNFPIILCMAEQNLAIGITLDYMAFADPRPNTVIVPFDEDRCIKSVYITERLNCPLSSDACTFKLFMLEWLKNNKHQLFHWDPFQEPRQKLAVV